MSLDRDTARRSVGHRAQVERGVRRQQDRLEQLLDVGALLGGDVDEDGLAAVLLGHQVVLGELLADLRRVGALDVDLVDRDDDRYVGSLGVVSASMVCGMTPSSAATTSTAMSVTFAPRARIAVKAS